MWLPHWCIVFKKEDISFVEVCSSWIEILQIGSEGVKNNKKKTVEYGKYGFMFITPFFLVFLVFQLYPLMYTF